MIPAADVAVDPADLLRRLWQAAVDAADPSVTLAQHLPPPPAAGGRTIVLGAGKAAGSMAAALEAAWHGPLEGLVVTRYGHGRPTRHIEVVEAGHPVPDAAGRTAAERIGALAASASSADLVICLISGGGSALLSLPPDGIAFADVQAITRALLASGADIAEMNTVRRHLSRINGGRLAAAAHPARVVTLAISDVPGDDPGTIASGPTVGDPGTCADALAILDGRGIAVPAAVVEGLRAGRFESIKPGDPRLAGADYRLIAAPAQSLQAAAAVARAAGVAPVLLGDALEGEAREVGRAMAGIARAAAERGWPEAAPLVLLSGGELTVTLDTDAGRGGPNTEFLLGLLSGLGGGLLCRLGVHALAGDTDGVDGSQDNAGAVVTPGTLARADRAGLDLADHLRRHDSYGYFQGLDDLLVPGPTLTNVNDFRAILVPTGVPTATEGAP